MAHFAELIDTAPMQDLESLRESIDALDAAIILLFGERARQKQKIGVFEAWHNLPSHGELPDRQQRERLKALAVQANLDPAFASDLLVW
ncbi:chorismate mutase [Beijerinckia sp. L45]|uniref:chorismate mutase n=1 Tax=Beijerinckia sp. L45 TaxID=1641855 RepID=UPI00131C4CF8|nr:chorismate mutase [Beijerinckia sp. L45]